MKKLILFIVGGLFLGLAVGSFVSGSRERDVILEKLAAEKAAAEAQEESSQDPQGGAAEEEASHSDPTAAHDESIEGGEMAEDEAPQAEIAGAEGDAQEDPGEAAGGMGEDHGAGHGDGSWDSNDITPPATASQSTLMGASAPETLAPEGPVRLAKIFAAMEPKDAAAVLQNLTDGEVRAILMNMSDRQVAEILGEFEPSRAATLSRIVLDARAGEATSR